MQMTIDFPGGMRVDAHVGPFDIRTDQPPAGSAPTPFTHFLASIGTCAGIYVLGFCRQRGIDTAGIHLTQRVRGDGAGHVADVEIDVHLPPGFPAKYREAVLRAADHCAVKEHLRRPPEIRIRAVVDEDAAAAVG